MTPGSHTHYYGYMYAGLSYHALQADSHAALLS